MLNITWAMVMGKRYDYNDVKLQKLFQAFQQLADFEFLTPITFVPGLIRYMYRIPVLKNQIGGCKDVENFIRVRKLTIINLR